MKKIVTVILEVDTDNTDKQIEEDLCAEINCACNFYEVKKIEVANIT